MEYRRTRSGACFGTYVLGGEEICEESQETCTSFEVTLAPLFSTAIEMSDAHYDQDMGDNEDTPLEYTVPRRHSPRLTPSTPSTGSLLREDAQAATGETRTFKVAQVGKIEAVRNKARGKLRRWLQKQRASSQPIPAYHPNISSLVRYANVPAMRIPFEPRLLPAGNYMGRRLQRLQGSKVGPWTSPELLGLGMELIEWDGKQSHIIADCQGRAMVILLQPPQEPTWMDACRAAGSLMEQSRLEAQERNAFVVGRKDMGEHRRGSYYSIPTGVSFGGGSVKPGNLKVPDKLQSIVENLCEDPAIKRIAGYQSGGLAFYCPKLYNNLRSYFSRLYEHSPNLRPNFPSCSIFPACTFNLGPSTITVDHTDHNNVAYGMCAVTALGDFDPTLGGHMVLFDLGLVIQFPPGTTILMPSSVLRHGNTPIVSSGGEQRMSITQYCAGGLFRWVDYGFQTGKSLASMAAGKAKKKEIDGVLKDRTTAALNLFSTVDSLAQDRASVFGRKAFRKL